jgi:hypothetical protein
MQVGIGGDLFNNQRNPQLKVITVFRSNKIIIRKLVEILTSPRWSIPSSSPTCTGTNFFYFHVSSLIISRPRKIDVNQSIICANSNRYALLVNFLVWVAENTFSQIFFVGGRRMNIDKGNVPVNTDHSGDNKSRCGRYINLD